MPAGFAQELSRRYVSGLYALSFVEIAGGVAVTLALLLSFAPWPREWLRYLRVARLLIVLACSAVAAGWAWRLRWLCDDAFISFRYARNLAEGHGLVFNPGEHVEGYTNFLWTVLVSIPLRVGVHPGQTAVVLGIAALVGSLLGASRVAARCGSPDFPRPIPVACILLASSYTFVSFGTSGLETMLATALAVWSLERAVSRHLVLSGALCAAATLTRPDHFVFAFALLVSALARRFSRVELIKLGGPLMLVCLPYFLWRWRYYGALLPNTYYAKSAGEWYLSQGAIYVALFAVGSGVLFQAPSVILGMCRQRSTLLASFAVIAVPVYVAYVAKVGGDFMYGRQLVPLLPFLAVLAEVCADTGALTDRVRFLRPFLLVIASLSALPVRLIRPSEKLWNVADESTFYQLVSFSPIRVDSPAQRWADDLVAMFGVGPSGPKVATGCVGIVGYVTRYPMIDAFGLTDTHVARRPLTARGRPGHEKMADPAYLVSVGVDLSDLRVYPPRYDRMLQVPGSPAKLVRFEPLVVDALRSRDRLPSLLVSDFIHQYEAGLRTSEEVECDLWFLETFYFAHYPGERERFVRRLSEDLSLQEDARSFLSGDPGAGAPPGWRISHSLKVNSQRDSDWIEGSTFSAWRVREGPPNQSEIGGVQGEFCLDSYTREDGDRATGVVQSAPFAIDGEVMTIGVGGGMDMQHVNVSLVVEGEAWVSATGCDSELVGRRVWSLQGLRGRTASIAIADSSQADWGHIIVADVVQWQR